MQKLAAYRLPIDLIDRLAQVSKSTSVSRSQIVRAAIAREVREREKLPPIAATKIARLHADLEAAEGRAKAAESADRRKQKIIERLLAEARKNAKNAE